MSEPFSLVLFSVDPVFIREAVRAGVDVLIVDWENVGKERRQASADTEINRNTPEDLRRVRAATKARVICRINPAGPSTPGEVETAVREGADEILLPMVRGPSEVQRVLDQARGRCGVGILVETVAALGCLEALARLPLSRVYVGLNDLAIERRSPNLFEPLLDGTLDAIRRPFRVPFGFGGLTLPERGAPIPCRLLMGEMARLSCSFSFLRRSFHADVRGKDLAAEVPRIKAALAAAFARRTEEAARDRAELIAAIESWRTVSSAR